MNWFFFLLLPLITIAQHGPTNLTLDTAYSNDLTIASKNDGSYDLKTTGNDPYIFTLPMLKPIPKGNTYLAFEYFCPTGVDFIGISFYPAEKGAKRKIVRDVGSTEGWVEFKIDISDALKVWGDKEDYLRLKFGNAPGLEIQFQNLKIRELTPHEKKLLAQKDQKRKAEILLKENLLTYLATDYKNGINRIIANQKNVKIEGFVDDDTPYFLAEIPLYQNVTEEQKFGFIAPIKPDDGKFDITLGRTINRHGYTQDRALSKWAIVQKQGDGHILVSHARYTDSIVPKHNYPFIVPKTIKGIGGYSINRPAPVSDLDSLDISSVTVNILINAFFRSEPSEKTLPFTYLGKTYYVDKESIANLDMTMKSAAERGIEVSAILLVGKASQAPDKEIGRILQHPDCDPAGIYSMPNMTTPEGVQHYAAVLDFLARRYSRPDKKYGRINHYIVHNEVDAGWVWTNAGDKEALVFMDLYHKSMRLSHNIAKSYHSDSKVFISLTHYWNWTSNPKFHLSKNLLEMLLDFSKKEGDFNWGIAHHPYPESLREPKTWLDKKVTFDFDTPLITFKNIEVLDAWVKQPVTKYLGKYKRMVYLSENGTNSPTYGKQDLKEQAAGMAYALKKVKYLNGINGFQYHNWQDNRKEGGLRIGLRKFPDDKEDPGGIKPVWKVYQAFGTPNEDNVFEPYKEIIGIQNWDEIRYTDEIGLSKKNR